MGGLRSLSFRSDWDMVGLVRVPGLLSSDNGLMRDSHLAEPNESRFDHHLGFRLVTAA